MKTCYGESWAHKGSIKQLVMYKERAILQFKGSYIKINMVCLFSLRVELPPVSGIRHLWDWKMKAIASSCISLFFIFTDIFLQHAWSSK